MNRRGRQHARVTISGTTTFARSVAETDMNFVPRLMVYIKLCGSFFIQEDHDSEWIEILFQSPRNKEQLFK